MLLGICVKIHRRRWSDTQNIPEILAALGNGDDRRRSIAASCTRCCIEFPLIGT